MLADTGDLQRRVGEHLARIYPAQDSVALAERVLDAMALAPDAPAPQPHRNLWDQRDAVLITYGDSVVSEGERPLRTLHRVLDKHIGSAVNSVHILPFFPYSSDDGFSVIDYLSVNQSLGEWEDITALSEDYRLMSDLVLNHASSRGHWFENFKQRAHPGKDYFAEATPADDLSQVVRPRSTPLLNPVQTAEGIRHVWCTFSPDQVDLNFANPELLLEFVHIVRQYLERGVRLFRMDAVAFLWKVPGTPCVHLPETHEIIKLLRTLIEHHTPDAVIITETNVPNRENLTYFGNANEAHAIYNFSLPPLLLYTLASGDCRHLKTWLMSMPPAQAGTAYLNFLASYDGIGLRPLEGLLSTEEQEQLLSCMQLFGGKVSMRQAAVDHLKPYEINISLFDAMQGTIDGEPDQWQEQRFLCAHTIMLALEGIPALYIHSLLATGNDYKRVEHTGQNRSINRHIWDAEILEAELADENSRHPRMLRALLDLLTLRQRQTAFHPNATQFTLHLGTSVFAFWRQSIDRRQSIFCLANITSKPQRMSLADINLIGTDRWRDLLSGDEFGELDAGLELAPYQVAWLSNLKDDADQ